MDSSLVWLSEGSLSQSFKDISQGSYYKLESDEELSYTRDARRRYRGPSQYVSRGAPCFFKKNLTDEGGQSLVKK